MSGTSPDPRIAWPAGHAPSSAVVFAHNTVEIAAAPQKVWALLTDCVAWPRWYRHCSNVSILKGGPRLQRGSKFRFRTLRTDFEPEVTTAQPARLLIWTANGPAGTSGAHAWLIEPTPRGCRVVTEEAQKGLLLHVVGRRLQAELLTNHEDWVQSLKRLAEAA